MKGPRVIEVEVAEPAQRVPARKTLTITDAELSEASLTPKCIVDAYLYADLAQLVAPGGTGKTTIFLYEAVRIALGRHVWGLKVLAPGWVLIVTAEDQRERLVGRLREIMAEMGLSDTDRQRVMRDVLVWDVTGQQVKLTHAHDGNLHLTTLADEIVDAYKEDPPVVVLFDPLVSFGVSEERINDNEQALVTAARRIIRGLGCCVRYIHHTGQAVARGKLIDQYSGRGGSALADGSRMTAVMQPWHKDDKRQPPPECVPDKDSSITVLARPKLSYAPPNLPLIWIKRTGFQFEHFIEAPIDPEMNAVAKAAQLLQFLTWELSQNRRYTKRQLEDSLSKLDMSRIELRAALTELQVSGQVVERDLPPDLRHGRRKTYLHPAQCADAVAQ